jgi:hypothetical protein
LKKKVEPQLEGYLLIKGMDLGVFEVRNQLSTSMIISRFFWFTIGRRHPTDHCNRGGVAVGQRPHPDKHCVGGPYPSIDQAVRAAVHYSRVPKGQIRFENRSGGSSLLNFTICNRKFGNYFKYLEESASIGDRPILTKCL